MGCNRCASDTLEDFNGEVAIHFPGLDGLTRPIVWAFPKLVVCLNCGHVEFLLADEQIAQLKCGVFPAQWAKRASAN